ncbi:MAG: hypothetical protein MUF87_16780 [Anaerolineae bacterium]|nr:hypothetical protein [Anaerolineae bacterium]
MIKVALIVITLFHFVSPPFNDDSSIFLPTRLDLPDSPMYAISSVGEDHVCLTITQQSVETLCIPFTNIAVIREVNLR